MIAIEAIDVPEVGTFFGFDHGGPNANRALVETGFCGQQLVCQMLIEHAWHLGRAADGTFDGLVNFYQEEGELDPESFGFEVASRNDVRSDETTWFREGPFIIVHPVDRAQLRRCLYPAMRDYRVLIGILVERHDFVMAQSTAGYGVSNGDRNVRSAAELAARDLGVALDWNAAAIARTTEGLTRLAQFDFP